MVQVSLISLALLGFTSALYITNHCEWTCSFTLCTRSLETIQGTKNVLISSLGDELQVVSKYPCTEDTECPTWVSKEKYNRNIWRNDEIKIITTRFEKKCQTGLNTALTLVSVSTILSTSKLVIVSNCFHKSGPIMCVTNFERNTEDQVQKYN